MRYYLMAVFMVLSLSVSLASCGTDDPMEEIEQPITPDDNKPDEPGNNDSPGEPEDNDRPDEPGEDNNGNSNPMSNKLKISVGSAAFNAILEDNETVAAFKALLPMTVNMSEMNGNEKYYYLPGSLPAVSSRPGTIHAGDLMLYGSSCVVLFYETFSTSYSYTRLGRVENPSGLASVLGTGSVTVTYELQ